MRLLKQELLSYIAHLARLSLTLLISVNMLEPMGQSTGLPAE